MAMYSLDAPELTSLRSMASDLHMMRATRRPMRPKPLMPPATAMDGAACADARRGAAEREFVVEVNAEAPETRRVAAVYFMVVEWRDVRIRYGRGAARDSSYIRIRHGAP